MFGGINNGINKVSYRTFFGRGKKDPSNYYKILGVSQSASPAQIKKAYLKLAKKYHPDMNKDDKNAQSKFAQINQAYQTLGDKEKRQMYDTHGMTGDQSQQFKDWSQNSQGMGGFGDFQQAAGGHGFQDFIKGFQDFFGEGSGFSSRKSQKKGRDVTLELEIQFMEAIHGTLKKVSYSKVAQCPTCKGTKCRPGTSPTACSACGGSGVQTLQQGPLVFQASCPVCGGRGSSIRDPCHTCNGRGINTITATETIKVPKGINNNLSLRMNKKGNFSDTGSSGDLLIRIKVKDDPYFRREGSDIHTDRYVTVTQAILGSRISLKTLSGDVNVTIEPGTSHGDVKKLSNYGAAKLPPNQKQFGHHYIHFKIKIPNKLNASQRQALQKYQDLEDQV